MKKAKKQAKIISVIIVCLLVCALLMPCLAGCGSAEAPAEVAAQSELGVFVDDAFVGIGTVLSEDLDYVADADANGSQSTYLDLGPIEEATYSYTDENGQTFTPKYLKGLFENVIQVDMDEKDPAWSKVGMIRINSAADHPLMTNAGNELENIADVTALLGTPMQLEEKIVWECDGFRLEITADEANAITSYILSKT